LRIGIRSFVPNRSNSDGESIFDKTGGQQRLWSGKQAGKIDIERPRRVGIS
jgi:hypothetical protein